MRLYLFIMTICIGFLHVSANVYAQKVTLSLQNANLEQIFSAIERQTGYGFWYEPQVLKGASKISVNVKDADMRDVLNECFKNQLLSYEIVDQTIVVRNKSIEIQPIQQQRRAYVIGKVVDENDTPLPKVTVIVKGYNFGTMTNEKGEFKITVPNDNVTLVFSSVGFLGIQVAVDGKRDILVRMYKETMQIKEIQISTGYEDIKPDRFIGSATVVDSAILERQTGRDLLTRLDGTTSGLIFNKSGIGAPGLQLQLRGVSTLNQNLDLNGLSSQNPLIILDDFPFTGDLNNINPNDISSVSVLKDAVATSIWGARAGNGVIVIKSKSGKYNQPPSVRFSSNISIVDIPNLEYFPQLTSSEFIDIEQDLFQQGFYDANLNANRPNATSPIVDILEMQRNGIISEDEAKAQIDMFRAYNVREDAKKYIFRRAVNKQNYINISGGSSRLSYNVSGGADNNLTNKQGPGKNNRYTLNSGFKVKLTKAIELNLGVNYNFEENRLGGEAYPIPSGGKSQIYPYARLADEEGDPLSIPYSYRHTWLESLPQDKLLNWEYRPLDERNSTDSRSKTTLLRFNIGSRINFNSWLSGEVKYQFTNQNYSNRVLNKPESYFVRDLVNRYTNPNTYERAIPVGGILDLSSNQMGSHNLRGQLNFKKSLRSVHDITALVAGEMGKNLVYVNGNRIYGFNDDVWTLNDQMDFKDAYPLFRGGNSRIPSGILQDERRNNLVSLIANAAYTYDSRYGIYVSGRRDGSNLFGVKTNNKYKPLWSVGARWNISNESFYKLEWLSSLNIRMTYGFAGNINNSIPAVATIFNVPFTNLFGQNYINLGAPPNPDLRWEEVRTTNLAMDFGLLKDRISGSLEWYRKKSKDVIAPFPVDPTLGVVSPTLPRNSAHLSGKGFEIVLKSQNIRGKFNWTTSINVSSAKTVVSKYFEKPATTPNSPIVREGDIYNGIYAYRWAGLDPSTGDPRGYIGKEISTDYQGIFFDSLENQAYVGSAFPLTYGNILNTFDFMGVSLSANISFRSNYYFLKPTINYGDLYNRWDGHSDYNKRWQKPGDEITTNIPSRPYPSNSNRDKFYQYAEINYEKGDHIRLQDIRVAYSLRNRHIRKLPIRSLEVFSYISNINLMIWKASGTNYDPDYPTSLFPPSVSYSFGVNINL